ncbi:hypothetical protein BCR42DRAFT_355261 [Absidia repens]|uniref:R3H domain-containing protein n=1 Tax=Absidia repens TaxID=90262 RepID=A0A1X2IAT6_9FUNG|nr:hypothetical protein BCR42DRAFT_355261 [Absidia repens]
MNNPNTASTGNTSNNGPKVVSSSSSSTPVSTTATTATTTTTTVKKNKQPANPVTLSADSGSPSTKKRTPRKQKQKAKTNSTAGESSSKNDSNTNSAINGKSKKTRPPRFNKQRAQGQLTLDDKPATVASSSSNPVLNSHEKDSNNKNEVVEGRNSKSDGAKSAKKKPANKRGNRKDKKKSGSSVPPPPPGSDDMASTMAYELSTSTYECMVCWDVVRPAHHTWTCDTCWAVFHINCIEKWATKSLKDTSTNMMITSWRCPGCQHKRTAIPQGYFCFCGKQQNPNPKHYQTPHTCEELCKRSRKCPHPCVLPCHPGPCPPCTSMGPTNVCFCGKDRRQARCVDTDYETNAYSCETVCDQRLGCGNHRCEEKCHGGLCPPCTVDEVHQQCYCGQSERTTRCGSGVSITAMDGRVGYYACEKLCTSTYDCGIHRCGKECHPCTDLKTCPYNPTIITTCPCGSSSIEDLLDGSSRSNCTDPIPTCGGICHKILPCGHSCQQKCHRGPCGSCEEQVKISCRCYNSEYDGICGTVSSNRPVCSKVCKSNRNCGRHTCGNTCCPAAKMKGKKRAQGSEKSHDCPLECGRLLSCGKHHCKENCHKGPCRPCLEATFDDVTCHCGRTRLEAPVRCGTQLPHCPHPCQRPSPCGHMRLLHHNCHPDDEPCPPCPVLISRECLCGKADLKNIPCYREAAHCGLICDKVLPCGEHRCKKSCHGGNCLADGQECTQPCGFTRTSCGHPCLLPCHGDSPCPETLPCSARIRASCACGQNAMEIPCNSSATSSGSNSTLECNDFCAKIQRNRRLASALDIQRDDISNGTDTTSSQQLSTDDLGYYDESIREFYVENINWCKQMEKQLIGFADDETQHSLHFKPMRSHFRWFLHRYAIHFNLSTEAMDPEPYRSVAVRKNLGQCRIPPILLSLAIRDPKLMAPPTSTVAIQDATAASSSTATRQQQHQQTRAAKPPVNALRLSGLAFGILQEDVDSILKPVLNSTTITYTSQWSKDSSNVVVIPNLDHMTDMEEKETLIWHWKKGLQSAFLFNDIAGTVECCWINRSGEMTWSEFGIAQGKSGGGSLAELKGKQALAQAQSNRFDLLGKEQEEDTAAAGGEEEGPADSDGQQTQASGHQDGDDEQQIEKQMGDDTTARKEDDWVAIGNEDVLDG